MDARHDQKSSTNSCSGWISKRRRVSRTWPPYCHCCPSLHKGPLASCLWHTRHRLYGGWFSPSTGWRSGQYAHPVGVVQVPTSSGPLITNQGHPGFVWWYSCSVNSTILVLLKLKNLSIQQYEHCFFGVRWQHNVSNLYSYTWQLKMTLHCPDKWTIFVAADPGSLAAHRFRWPFIG